jgi:hypothetical protein
MQINWLLVLESTTVLTVFLIFGKDLGLDVKNALPFNDIHKQKLHRVSR